MNLDKTQNPRGGGEGGARAANADTCAAQARKSPGFCASSSWSGDAVRRVPALFASLGGQSHVL